MSSVSTVSVRYPVANNLMGNICSPTESTLAFLGAGLLSYYAGFTSAWLTATAGALLLGSKAVTLMNKPLYTLAPASPHVTFDNLEEALASLYNDLVQAGLEGENRGLAIQRYERLNAIFIAGSEAQKAGGLLCKRFLQNIYKIIVTPTDKPTAETSIFAIERLYEELAQTLDHQNLATRFDAILQVAGTIPLNDPARAKLWIISDVFTSLRAPIPAIYPNEKLYAFKVKRLLHEIKQGGVFFFNRTTLLQTYERRVQDLKRLDGQPGLVVSFRDEAVRDLQEARNLLGVVAIPSQVAAAAVQVPLPTAAPAVLPAPPAQARGTPLQEHIRNGIKPRLDPTVEQREWQLRPIDQIDRRIRKHNLRSEIQGLQEDRERRLFLTKYRTGYYTGRDSELRDAFLFIKGAAFSLDGAAHSIMAEPASNFVRTSARQVKRVGNYTVGIAHNIGRRTEQEDRDIAVEFTVRIAGRDYPIQLFGIFDGHGGTLAADYVKDHLQEALTTCLLRFNEEGLTDAGIWNALKLTFPKLHNDYKKVYLAKRAQSEEEGFKYFNTGTTATVAMILDGKLWTANVGDSRTILNANGTGVQLTEDAKPTDLYYLRGIINRGGMVPTTGDGIGRVDGILAVGRTIGDLYLLDHASARPKITMKKLTDLPRGTDLILACDGIYDVATTPAVAEGVQKRKREPHVTCGDLAMNIIKAASDAGSRDNLSAMVLSLK